MNLTEVKLLIVASLFVCDEIITSVTGCKSPYALDLTKLNEYVTIQFMKTVNTSLNLLGLSTRGIVADVSTSKNFFFFGFFAA